MTLEERYNQVHQLIDETSSSPYSHDALDLAMSCVTSLELTQKNNMPLVWLMIVGVPSSDKTENIKYFRDADKMFYLDTMTINAITSGMKRDKKDADLLPKLNGKSLIIKDLTTLLSSDSKAVNKLLGEFQSIYDGEFIKAAGGEVDYIKYESVFSFLACVTPHKLNRHRQYMSEIGSRFLFYRIPQLEDDEVFKGFDLIRDHTRKQKKETLKQLVVEHINDLQQEPIVAPSIPSELEKAIDYLSILVARARAVPAWSDDGNVTSVQREEPFRPMQQLTTLGYCLSRVRGKNVVGIDELYSLYKVAMSTMSEDCAAVLSLFEQGAKEVTIKSCSKTFGKSEKQLRTTLTTMNKAGLLDRVKNNEYKLNQLISKAIEYFTVTFTGHQFYSDTVVYSTANVEQASLSQSSCKIQQRLLYQQFTLEIDDIRFLVDCSDVEYDDADVEYISHLSF